MSHRGVETGLPLIPLLYPGQVVGILQVELGENGSPKEGFEGQVDQGTEYLFFLVIFLERRTLHLQERKGVDDAGHEGVSDVSLHYFSLRSGQFEELTGG